MAGLGQGGRQPGKRRGASGQHAGLGIRTTQARAKYSGPC
jgi:hypothetical protein